MGGSSPVQFQTPTPLYEAENQIFGALPWANTQGQAQNAAYTGIGNLSNFTNIPGADQLISNALGLSGYGNQLGAAAPNALNIGTAAAQGGQDIYGQVSPYIGQALQQGFDPQNALYNKLFQQQQDQANAENAMAGVATTPYGADLVNQGNQNFNIAWQQAQLANQAQGANTAATLAQTGLGGLTGGANALATGYGAAGNALSADVGAQGGAFSVPYGIQSYGAGNTQTQIQDYINYILGNTQNSAAYTGAVNASTNAAAASTNSLANAQQAANSGKGGIGSALSGIGSLVGKFATGGIGP